MRSSVDIARARMLDTPSSLTAFATDNDTTSQAARLRTYATGVMLMASPNDRSTWTTPWRQG